MNTMIKALFTTLAASLTVFALAGCAVSTESRESIESTEDIDTAEQSVASSCGCSGAYTCVSNGWVSEYESIGCGVIVLTKTRALTQCNSRCGGTACVDSGWFCP